MKALKCLAPRTWLKDEIIDSMIALLPLSEDVLVLDTIFYTWLSLGKWDRLASHNLTVRNGPKLMVCPLYSAHPGEIDETPRTSVGTKLSFLSTSPNAIGYVHV